MTELPVIHHRGQLVDARLHLLDRQLLDDEDSPAGIVDDLVLSGVELDKDIPEGTEAPQLATSLLSVTWWLPAFSAADRPDPGCRGFRGASSIPSTWS